MLNDIKSYIKNTKTDGIVARLKSNVRFWAEIEGYTKNMDCESNSEKIYLYINQLDKPICSCGSNKNVKFISITNGFREFCSSTCSAAIAAQTSRRCATLLKNGGIGLSNPKSKLKQQQTLKQKYGDGIINPGQLDKHRCMMASDQNPMKNPDVVQKYRKNYFDKTGVDNPAQIMWPKGVFDRINDVDWLQERILEKNVYDLSHDMGIHWTTLLHYLNKFNLRTPYQNTYETEIKQILNDLNIDYKSRCRSIIYPQELDIVIDRYKVAIEICGLYWHSEITSNRDKFYHYNKLKKTNEKGYRLITIFEDEWINKKHICKNRILNAINHSKIICGARKLYINQIDSITEKMFLNENHIQGYTPSDVCYGAFYNNKLVSVMSFSKPRIALGRMTGSIELLRYTTDGCVYPGVASKLFKTYLKDFNPDSVISYCDLRWGTGVLYTKMGFTFVDITKPNYWYIKPNKMKREHRFAHRKSVLVKKGYDSLKTEWQIMQELNYDRIWDCGHAKYIWKNPNV